MRKYAAPDFVVTCSTQAAYSRWLHWRAIAHVKRDKKRGNTTATNESYKKAIHQAVCLSNGKDAYTGEPLDWSLLSKYDNAASQQGGRKYKAGFALLPTVDHVGDGLGPADFKICGWRTNDAKHDLTLPDFLDLCRRIIGYHAADEVPVPSRTVTRISKTTQNRTSGANASMWGREIARKIALAIGASAPTGTSNECELAGERVVIKCAALKTDSVGITYLMLERISEVIGAFQNDDATFDVWSLPVTQAKAAMRPTASRGASAGRVGIVRRALFYEKGRRLQRVQIE